VADIDEAMNHIERYGSKHTDAIITNNKAQADRFLREVDSASVMVKATVSVCSLVMCCPFCRRLKSGRNSPRSISYQSPSLAVKRPVKVSWWALFSRPCVALLPNLLQASGPRPMPSDAWSAVHVPLTEAPVLGRSMPRQWPVIRGPVTACRWSIVTGSRRVALVMWWPDTIRLSVVRGPLSIDRTVTGGPRPTVQPVICHRLGSLGPFCQVTDLSSAMRDPPFAGRVAWIGLNHCFCHNHSNSKRSIVRVLLTNAP
jgi:hypothetical protein